MNFISVIPARAGSKGIKNKNIFKINNKPLVEYTFKTVSNSKIKNNYILTDSNKIKEIVKKFSIKKNYIRPKSLSGSKTSLNKTLSHFYLWLKNNKISFDYLVVLQPTSPLRTKDDINKAINIVRKYKPKSLFSISESLEHPYEAIKVLKKDKWKFILNKSKKYFRRQDFDLKSFFINGAIYIIHKSLLKENKTYNFTSHRFYKMPKIRSIEINDIEEVKIVESIIKGRNYEN